MANKQLTATVRINSTQAEQKLRNLTSSIDRVNRAASMSATSYTRVNSTLEQSANTTKKIDKGTKQIASSTNVWSLALNLVLGQFNQCQSEVDKLRSKLSSLVNKFLGVMTLKMVIDTSDTITSAENKLNYVASQQLGDKAYNADGSYSSAVFQQTQDAMDRMYVSSQKVRMGYTDMMTNVSKSMALAGNSFDNNTNKAIRFQEIMAEAYAVGGASAQEMSSSMYQMIQALGSGTLAGDELRSVREGAPLAYKAIEEFAQGVYNTTDSLKELASQGKITSDMVVAAIINAGDKMDSAFAQTEQTFGQTLEQIKNVAIKSFEPVAKMLRKGLNDAIDNGLVEKATKVFTNIAKGIMIVFAVIQKVIVWIVNNWDWLQHIVIAGLILYISYMLICIGVALVLAAIQAFLWLTTFGTILLVISAVLLLIYFFYLWYTGAIDTCQVIYIALVMIGAAILMIGIITGNVILMIIGLVILLTAFVFTHIDTIAYRCAWLAAWIVNIASAIMNFLCAVMSVIVVAFYNLGADIVNGSMGIWNVIKAITENIGIAFSNAWIWAKNTFWEFIADVLEGVSKLEPVINGIASLLDKEGVDFGGLASSARSRKSEYREYVSVGDAWSSGWNTVERLDYGDAWNNAMSTFEYVDPNAWATTAGDWGTGIKNKINDWGSKFQKNKSKDTNSFLDGLAGKLGLNFDDFGLPDLTNPNNDISNLLGDNGKFDDPGKIGKNVGDIADNTDKIADGLDLTKEDLEYLRKVAEMEWKKEYTTANITVDMTNNNTINGETDLDGIVTKLADKLYEEMNIVANGVYAY